MPHEVVTIRDCTLYRGHWYDIESGRAPNPTLKTLLDMCSVLECDISQLVNTSPHQ